MADNDDTVTETKQYVTGNGETRTRVVQRKKLSPDAVPPRVMDATAARPDDEPPTKARVVMYALTAGVTSLNFLLRNGIPNLCVLLPPLCRAAPRSHTRV